MSLNPNDIDYAIELFWYGFKQSMINFYESINKNYMFIIEWSNKLNELKKNKMYSEIEMNIRDYIKYYSFDLIQYSKNIHYDNILVTNIKRWNNISDTSIPYNKIVILFMIYLELKKQNTDINMFNTIEKVIETNDYDKFIIWSLTHKKTKILNLLTKLSDYNIYENIKRIFPNLIIKDKMRMNKICKKFLYNTI